MSSAREVIDKILESEELSEAPVSLDDLANFNTKPYHDRMRDAADSKEVSRIYDEMKLAQASAVLDELRNLGFKRLPTPEQFMEEGEVVSFLANNSHIRLTTAKMGAPTPILEFRGFFGGDAASLRKIVREIAQASWK